MAAEFSQDKDRPGRRWPAPLGNQPHLGSAARQVVRAGDPDNAATDDRDPEL